jgi:hypothetical protein
VEECSVGGLLEFLGSLGGHVLQKGEGPVEETLCFSIVPLALLVGAFAWRGWRSRGLAGAQRD